MTPVFLIIFAGLIEVFNYATRDTLLNAKRFKMFDEELGWTNFPSKVTVQNNVTYTTNSMGFRSKEIDPKREKIIIAGDSLVFGLGVQDNETAAFYLGQKYPEMQVLNLGVAGYGIGQYYIQLKQYLSKIKPKLVGLVICVGNDIKNTQNDTSYGYSKPLFIIENGKLKTHKAKISRFSCPNLFSTSWWLQKNPFSSLKDKYCSSNNLDTDYTRRVILRLLSEIDVLVKSHGAKMFLVLWPSQSNFDDEKAIVDFMREAKKKDPKLYAKHVMESTPFYFMNTLKAFKIWLKDVKYPILDFLQQVKGSYSLEESKKLYRDHYHMSPPGSKLLALEMEKFIQQKQLL